MSNLNICTIEPEVLEKCKKFRFRRKENEAAIVLKIDPKAKLIKFEEEFEDMTLDDLQYELPDQSPRYLVYSFTYTHEDGRKSSPMIFILISPEGGKYELNMMYSGSMLSLTEAIGVTKVYQITDLEELTQKWVLEQLAFFK
eukprot:CFRG0623T1